MTKETQIELVQEIVKQAMLVTEAGIAHVHVNYAGHCNTLCVSAYPANTDYSGGEQKATFRHSMMAVDDTDRLAQALNDINKLWSEKNEQN